MRKTLACAMVLIAIGFVSCQRAHYHTISSDFPNLLLYEKNVTCKDEYSPLKSNKVRVDMFLYNKNEHTPHNEVVTLITFVDSQQQFAARHIFENVGSRNPEQTTESRRVYVKSVYGWGEVPDYREFIAEVVRNAPKEYLLDYELLGDPGKPTSEWWAYRNLLRNAGCSLHGPVG